jgi:hypothetical protein
MVSSINCFLTQLFPDTMLGGQGYLGRTLIYDINPLIKVARMELREYLSVMKASPTSPIHSTGWISRHRYAPPSARIPLAPENNEEPHVVQGINLLSKSEDPLTWISHITTRMGDSTLPDSASSWLSPRRQPTTRPDMHGGSEPQREGSESLQPHDPRCHC